MDEDDARRRELINQGRAYGIALAEFAIETFVSEISEEQAEAAASAMRSDLLERGGEMMDGGMPPALAIAWGEACAAALQERLAQQGAQFRRLAALLASPAVVTRQ